MGRGSKATLAACYDVADRRHWQRKSLTKRVYLKEVQWKLKIPIKYLLDKQK